MELMQKLADARAAGWDQWVYSCPQAAVNM